MKCMRFFKNVNPLPPISLTFLFFLILITAEVEKHLDLMIEILPNWLTVHNIRKEKYIKMNKMLDINDIISKVQKVHKESK